MTYNFSAGIKNNITEENVAQYIKDFSFALDFKPQVPYKEKVGAVYMAVPTIEVPNVDIKIASQVKIGQSEDSEKRMQQAQTWKEYGYTIIGEWETDLPQKFEMLFKRTYAHYNTNEDTFLGGREIFSLPRELLRQFRSAKDINAFMHIVTADYVLNPVHLKRVVFNMRKAVRKGTRTVTIQLPVIAKHDR